MARHSEGQQRLALLIDADNAPPAVIDGLLAEAARFGSTSVKRIYGDWTSPRLNQWKRQLLKHSIQPVQQFAYTSGKNATDSALIIDAMDLLYTGNFDGFCLVTSDSDFTGLAVRLREEGLLVYGFGEQKTPEAFRNACHKFIFTEVLRPLPSSTIPDTTVVLSVPEKPALAPSPESSPPPAAPKKALPLQFVLQALDQASDDTGWANLAAFGSYLTKLQSDFDPRLYGFKKLSDLVKSKPHVFTVEEREVAGTNSKVIYVRRKAAKTVKITK